MENQNLLSENLTIDSISHSHLLETSRWAKLMAIVGFVGSVFIAIFGLFFGSMFSQFAPGSSSMFGASGMMVGLLYLIIGAVYFFISLFLYRFATRMKIALMSADQENLISSFYNLKLVYKILGIIILIYLAFLALALVFSIFLAASR